MLDFSVSGLKEGAVKVLKVAGWIALSGALVALADWVGNITVEPSNYWLVATVGVVNAVLAGLIKWVTTKK